MVVGFAFFFVNETAPTEIYTLSLHDALPISDARHSPGYQRHITRNARPNRANRAEKQPFRVKSQAWSGTPPWLRRGAQCERSEEHTSELQSRRDLVCRLLLEKKKDREGVEVN